MSEDRYGAFLRWEQLRQRGVVKFNGVTADLKERPPVLMRLVDFFYSPEVDLARGRDGDGKLPIERPLTQAEQDEADDWIAMLATGWRLLVHVKDRRGP